jgi:hypothetical protein
LKILASIFLSGIIFIQTFSAYFIKADFLLNQSYIAENLCVNRDKPMMHCNGKCYLSKKINEQEKKDHSPVSRTEKLDLQVYYLPETVAVPPAFEALTKAVCLINDSEIFSSFSPSIFHPPAV